MKTLNFNKKLSQRNLLLFLGLNFLFFSNEITKVQSHGPETNNGGNSNLLNLREFVLISLFIFLAVGLFLVWIDKNQGTTKIVRLSTLIKIVSTILLINMSIAYFLFVEV